MIRACVFLCVLAAAFAQNSDSGYNNPWSGPDGTVNEPNNQCTDPANCACCSMLQQVNKMRTHFNNTLNELEKDFEKTQKTLKTIEEKRTAFSVGLYTTGFKCFGPFSVDSLVTYKHIFINLGNNYDASTGIFTVPYSGVYSLTLTVYSDAGAQNTPLVACANLQVNNNVVAGTNENNKQDQEDAMTVAMALHLNVGDRVSVNLPVNCFLCDDDSHYNTFSGFLLYADI